MYKSIFLTLSIFVFVGCGSNDKDGNKDQTPPVITLVGQSPMAVIKDDTYIEYGAVAVDARDGNITVLINGSVDTSKVDSYTITYKAMDKTGNEANATRTIYVTEPIPLKKTEQSKSYTTDGTEVVDDSLKDDGHYKLGVNSSYSRDDSTNIVTDNVSKLMWQDDLYVENNQTSWLSEQDAVKCDDNNNSSSCTNFDKNNPITYCSNLSLGGYSDWRVPTIQELNTIMLNRDDGTVIDGSFFEHNNLSTVYWSETKFTNNRASLWTMGAKAEIETTSMGSFANLRCVRNDI